MSQNKYSIEEAKSIHIGLITMVIVLMLVFITVFHSSSIKKSTSGNTYRIYANFGKTDGLNVGDIVRMSGVKIGRVVAADLDEHFNSRLTLEVDSSYKIPEDSSASIVSFGLIGGKYVEIDVGGSDEYLKSGEYVSYTQDAMVIEDLLDRIISMGKNKKSSNKENNGDDNE